MAGSAQSLSAVTLITHDMAASVAFYVEIDLERAYGGPGATFTSFHIGPSSFLNLQFDPGWVPPPQPWGRFIVWVDDVDAAHQRLVDGGHRPASTPADAPWGERYFHVVDPAGHEISIARPL